MAGFRGRSDTDPPPPPPADRFEWPTAMAEWTMAKWSGAEEGAPDANHLLMQQRETRAASDRPDGINKSPLPTYSQFEE